MKLSEVHQELLSNMYPKGYVVPEGEKGHYHVMFVDILNQKGARSQDQAMIQKFFPLEWSRIRTAIEKYGIGISGHNEYAVIYDPTKIPEPVKEVAEVKQEPAKEPVKRVRSKPVSKKVIK